MTGAALSTRAFWHRSAALSGLPVDRGNAKPGQLATALLVSVSLGALIISMQSALADEIIDGGTIVTIPGTYSSPWAVAGTLIVGNAGQGTLNVIAGGAVTSNQGNIANQTGSNGTVTVTTGSWDTGGFELHVGTDGTGNLNVEAGGLVTSGAGIVGYNTNSDGTATVTGQNSHWNLGSNDLFVGFSSTGEMNIEAGGRVTSGYGFIGYNSAGDGTVTVTGENSVWDLGDRSASVGYGGTGTLNIENGGRVTSAYANIGVQSGSTGIANVRGQGSSWDLGTETLSPGYDGNGTLNIESGARVDSGDGVIGYNSSAIGTATVTGQNSTWDTGSHYVYMGHYGSGTLTVEDGGQVITARTVIGHEAASSGILNLDGTSVARGTLTTQQVVKGDGTASFNIDGGVLKAAGDEADFLSNFSAGDIDIRSGGAFLDTNGYDIAIAAVLGGTGGLTKQGNGILTLSGADTYAGATRVEDGTLIVNGSIASSSSVTIASGAGIGGNGTVSDLILDGGSTLRPGNSIGTLNAASATFNSGMTYEVEVNSAGASDLLSVTGATVINGGDVVVLPYPDFATNTPYTIITSTGGVTGTFSGVEFGAASLFLTAMLSYDANNVYLEIDQQAFAAFAAGPNQKAVAAAAQSLGPGNPVYDALLGLTTAGEAQQAFDALSGEVHASVAGVLVDNSRYVRDAVFSRLLQASYAGSNDTTPLTLAANGPAATAGRMALGATDKSATALPPARSLAFWAQGYGAWGDVDGNTNTAAVDRTLGGFVTGMDAGLGGGWRAGVATGYARTAMSVDARFSSADIDSYDLIGYVGGHVGAFALRGGGAWTWSDIDTSRTIAFPRFLQHSDASYHGDTGQIFGELALPLFHEESAWEPFARLAYIDVNTGGFAENGAAGLVSSGADESLGYTVLGVRAATTLSVAGALLTPHASLAWQHALGDVDPAASLAFASGGAGFTVLGAPVARDSALLDAGLMLTLSDDASLGLAYSGQIADDVTDNAVTGRLDWRF